MQTEEITIRVDPEAARAYRAAPDEMRRKLDFLMNMRIHDAMRTADSLEDVMRDISGKGKERGMTPEILESILHEH